MPQKNGEVVYLQGVDALDETYCVYLHLWPQHVLRTLTVHQAVVHSKWDQEAGYHLGTLVDS